MWLKLYCCTIVMDKTSLEWVGKNINLRIRRQLRWLLAKYHSGALEGCMILYYLNLRGRSLLRSKMSIGTWGLVLAAYRKSLMSLGFYHGKAPFQSSLQEAKAQFLNLSDLSAYPRQVSSTKITNFHDYSPKIDDRVACL